MLKGFMTHVKRPAQLSTMTHLHKMRQRIIWKKLEVTAEFPALPSLKEAGRNLVSGKKEGAF